MTIYTCELFDDLQRQCFVFLDNVSGDDGIQFFFLIDNLRGCGMI